MKLKKIASLALAGVMAVSMLAGCSGKGNTTEDGSTINTSTSSIVTALNNGQDADNDAKVTFSSDSNFNAVVQKAIAMEGDDADESAITSNIGLLTGKYGNFDSGDFTATKWTAFETNGTDPVTVLTVGKYDQAYWTESTVLEDVARRADEKIADLKASTKKGTAQGADYWDYTYTGTASMVTVKDVDGTTSYYVAVTVTRTGVKGTIPKV